VSAWVTCECKVQEFKVVKITICGVAVLMNLTNTKIKIENVMNK
jgi:hypothetical protein